VELIYLWVEGYKNINRQGFNFSPRFYCHYDGETLTIDDNVDKDGKKQYIENFFGDKINVTAIVGKNGSGKSNLLDLLFYPNIVGNNFNKKKDYFFIYIEYKTQLHAVNCRLNGKKYIHLDKAYKSFKVEKDKEQNNKIKSIYFNNFYKKLPINYHHLNSLTQNVEYKYDISLLGKLKKNESENIYAKLETQISSYYLNNIKNSILLLKNNILKLPKDFSKPESIFLNYIYIDKNFEEFNHFTIKENDLEEHLIRVCLYLFYKYGFSSDEDSYYKKKKEEYKIEKFQKESKNYKDVFDSLKKDISKDLENTTPKYFGGDISNIINFFNDISNLFDIFKKYKYSFEEFPDNFIETYLRIIKETQEFINFNWHPHLSTGEETLLFQFANFYSVLKEDRSNFFIFIDEGENTLHPNWQKKYISYLVQFFRDNFPKIEFHIVLTSHSPFIVSDLPKDNILFMKEGKEDKGVHKQTFGANIHTLLSDSFFMEDDGLMGEFAKNKIQEIMDFLNNKKKIEEISTKEEQIKQVIESIGETFLKDKLLRMYYDKFDTKKQERIKELKAELKRLENG